MAKTLEEALIRARLERPDCPVFKVQLLNDGEYKTIFTGE
jgi:hypothetical protein